MHVEKPFDTQKYNKIRFQDGHAPLENFLKTAPGEGDL